jgi:hypothetical protein
MVLSGVGPVIAAAVIDGARDVSASPGLARPVAWNRRSDVMLDLR